jgi:RNA recognition motif-containing protein
VVQDNPSDKDVNQGTLVVFNLDASVSNDDLRHIFGVYGEVKEVSGMLNRFWTSVFEALHSQPSYYNLKDNVSLVREVLVNLFSQNRSYHPCRSRVFSWCGCLMLLQCAEQIRETPHKRHHKFIEFYDVRAAEAALRSLNRSDIAGKRIKLEPSRPGGARRRSVSASLIALLTFLTFAFYLEDGMLYWDV